jgi:hypothetical protein
MTEIVQDGMTTLLADCAISTGFSGGVAHRLAAIFQPRLHALSIVSRETMRDILYQYTKVMK